MSRLTTIEISKQYLSFAAAHFTIFSATDRERLHGHNYRLSATFQAPVGPNGMTFDYNVFKNKLKDICIGLDEYLLLPAQSPYLNITAVDNNFVVKFGDEVMTFLQSDTLLLPILNTTVEEYSDYILGVLRDSSAVEIDQYGISRISVRVGSGDGQSGSADWSKSDATP
ncbi:6-carboxytetrahydropterin synthase [Oceanicoccus sp. KOV_DT_Chl]|uniref:6-pyruvoyl trahydropterin synthase family protein n=1 Tax=Oceanicoccus sp. KOV_DT_Chl TaxID=1904639 RepID=UPI000C7D67A9|nr:6-carboxytetrahydropterin synthase [Oceanicoccus sp. KOV_DT_Chl]